MDNLSLSYKGNRPTKVTDTATDPIYSGAPDFQDGANSSTEMTYDANGNLISDLNRSVESIEYNPLNLPYMIDFGDGCYVRQIYSADGTLLRQIRQESVLVIDPTPSNVQVGFPKYEKNTKYTDYRGPLVYESFRKENFPGTLNSTKPTRINTHTASSPATPYTITSLTTAAVYTR